MFSSNQEVNLRYSIVVPLHNECENVPDLYSRLKTVMEGIHEREVRLGLPPGTTKEVCP